MRASGSMLIDFLARDSGNQFKVFRRNWIRCIVAVIVHSYGLRYVDLANGGDESNDLDSKDLLQIPLSNGTCSHATCQKFVSVKMRMFVHRSRTNGLSGTAATATTAGLDAVLLEVSIIGMARTRVEVSLRVVMGPVILVLYEETNGCAEGDTMLDARLDMDGVLLISLKDTTVSHKNSKERVPVLTGVVRLLWPGLRRLSCVWMSVSLSSRPWRCITVVRKQTATH
jgi:hypothetical protein